MKDKIQEIIDYIEKAKTITDGNVGIALIRLYELKNELVKKEDEE